LIDIGELIGNSCGPLTAKALVGHCSDKHFSDGIMHHARKLSLLPFSAGVWMRRASSSIKAANATDLSSFQPRRGTSL